MEIERKFRLRERPENLDTYPVCHIVQGYISREPVIRVRSLHSAAGQQYRLTVKGQGLIEREEFELPLTEREYSALCRKVEGEMLEKRRYRIKLDGNLVAEVDEFLGCLEGLWLAEVEFASADDMAAFVPPPWFGEEVSGDVRFQNSALSLMKEIP